MTTLMNALDTVVNKQVVASDPGSWKSTLPILLCHSFTMPYSETSSSRKVVSTRYVALEVCLDSFDCGTLRKLAFTSRATRAKVKDVVQQRLPQLLHDAAAAVVAAAALLQNTDWPEARKARRILAWLLTTAGRRALNQPAAAEALMHFANAHRHLIAATAVKCGFRPTFQQILEAAKSSVPGAEQWARCILATRRPPLWSFVCENSRVLMVSAAAAADRSNYMAYNEQCLGHTPLHSEALPELRQLSARQLSFNWFNHSLVAHASSR
jgi:hypothetical protein